MAEHEQIAHRRAAAKRTAMWLGLTALGVFLMFFSKAFKLF